MFEVNEPILNSPFDPPSRYWYISEGEAPQKREGRRAAVVFPPRDQRDVWTVNGGLLRPSPEYPSGFELALVQLIRERLADWERQGYPGVTRTTLELLQWWTREGREKRLFFAQLEAARTIIFLNEARANLLQGIAVPRDEPSDERRREGFKGFLRYACKMATGSGKTTVMGMLAAWSILNKVNSKGDARFSDVALVVCPNVTIRHRLGELDPERGEASIYRTRDLVPMHLMPLLTRGKVLVTNWHVFEPQTMQIGGVSARVSKAGAEVRTKETITIGPKSTTARGTRYLSLADLDRQAAAGLLAVIDEERDKSGELKKVRVEASRYVESDTALLNRVLGREIGGKQNILVLNDEAHHAYRINQERPENWEQMEEDERDDWLAERDEATVWVDGLDKIHKHRGHQLLRRSLGDAVLPGQNRAGDISTLEDYRRRSRIQELVFDIARSFTKQYTVMPQCTVPAHALFPQLVEIVRRYIHEKVIVNPPGDLKDVGLSPYYGWLVEILAGSLRPDTSEGEAPEVPRYEANRAPGSTADVDYWTSRDVREVQKSHLNFVVAHTTKWEQSAAYFIDTHPAVEAFVKNEGLGFAIPYFNNGQDHDYMPDFIIRMKDANRTNLILETKGYDPLEEAKVSAAKRWVEAVNAEGAYGRWAYRLAKKRTEVAGLISAAAQ